MSKSEKVEFEKLKHSYQLLEAERQRVTGLLQEFQHALGNTQTTVSNQQQQIANLTLERTVLFQSLWDSQKIVKERNAEIAQLKSQPQTIGLAVFYGSVDKSEEGK